MEKTVLLELLLMLVICNLCWSVEEQCPPPCDCQHPQHILCSNRGLFSIPKSSHILSLSGTKTYSLGGNFISNITVLDFSNYYHLQRLDLQYNQIHCIHPKAFEKLMHLEELYLGNNLLPALASGAFSSLKKLKVLNVNSNRIQNVSRASFSNLMSLIKLRLDSNSIQTLQGSPFSGLSNLLYLHLENNKISNISKNAFVGLVKLRLLSLSGNPLNSLRQPTFLPLRSLSTLTMARNNLQQLGPGVFHGLQRLSKLILSSNNISLLHSKTLQGLELLQELHLDGNSLITLPEDFLASQHSLEVLNLSLNALSELHPGTFNGLNRLRVLDLQHNMLRFLPGDILSGNPSLYRLQLDGNQWNCDCHLLGLKHWILGTLHTRSRMLTVFVQCREPQEVAGKYLDYLEDAYLHGIGGCIVNTTPPGLASTILHQDLVLHHSGHKGKGKPSTEPVEQTLIDSKAHLMLPVSTLPSKVTSLLQTLTSVQDVSTTKQPLEIKKKLFVGRQKVLHKGKGKKIKTSGGTINPSDTKHSRQQPVTEKQVTSTLLPQTEPLKHLHLKLSEALLPESNNVHHTMPVIETFLDPMQPTSKSGHTEITGTLQSALERLHTGELHPELKTLYQDSSASKTMPQSQSDSLQPSFDSFHHGQSETLHQVAPFPLALSDPCEFNKLYLLNLSVEFVGSTTARVRWQTLVHHTHGLVLFRVLYERFGQDGRFQRFIYPRGQAESLTLQELTGDTPYLVCVESIIGGRACPVAPRDHCVGLVTLPPEAENPLLNYQMLALGLLALNALLLFIGLVAWGSKMARKKWWRRRAPVHVRQMYSTRRPHRSVGTGVSTDFSGFQSHRPRTAMCALGEADLIEFPGCDRFRDVGNIHREDLLQRFTD